MCALTAGPGVTNAISAIASARENHSPVLALGGRAPAFRWGQGSLQEMDHVPFLAPLTKLAATAGSTAEIPQLLDRAMRAALAPHSGRPLWTSRWTTCSWTQTLRRSPSRCPSPGGAPAPAPTAIRSNAPGHCCAVLSAR